MNKSACDNVNLIKFKIQTYSVMYFYRIKTIKLEDVKKLVTKFIETNPKLNEYSRNVVVDSYYEAIDGIQFFITYAKNPQGKPFVIVGDKKFMVDVGIIKCELIKDGQARK